MKTFQNLTLAAGLFVGLIAGNQVQGATLLLGDSYNVTGSGSGFALNAGVNSGINPPTTRLTGSVAAGLRYINTSTKPTTAYTIVTNKVRIAAVTNAGRFTFSSNGTNAFDFGSALGIGAARPMTPVTYDVSVSVDNDSTGTQRCSFALGTAEGDATTWAFGFQVYRTNSANNFYVIGKRIDTTSSGLASDLNSVVNTMAAASFGTEITVLMRVTDAGSETSTYNSRVQLSLNGGSTWIYDTATDSDLAGTGFRLNGAGRYLMWDIAPDAGPVTYDNFSLNWNSGPRTWTGGGANGNWSNGTNWAGAAPITGTPLTFSGTTRQVNTNDIVGLNIPSLTFNNSGFTVWGNTLTNSAAITNLSGNNTLKAPLAWSSTAVKTWSISTGSELLLDNTTSIDVIGDHSVIGGGTLRQKGTVNFTANPVFAINEGKHIVDGGTFNTIGGYRIGSQATGAGAQTILTNGANLTITASGGNLRVGDSANPVASRLDIDNSTLTLTGGVHLALPYAAGAIGVVSQVGGTVSPGTIQFSDVGAGTGSYTIKNGTLVTRQIRKNISGGSSSIYFDNATLRTDTGALSAFLNTLDVAQIQSGGLTLDVLSDIVVDQALSGTGALTKTGSAVLTLNGANSFSGATTISAGTLTLGAGGSIGSSPSITVASGATYNVSAVTGYALGAAQTLVRNASSGAGNITGSVIFNAGAQVSLQADGTAGTVGTLSVAGGLTLNGNTLTINVSGSALAAGTYRLITYSGTKSGSFNSTPVITGSGVAPGYLVQLVETTGQISLRVYSNGRNWSGGGADGNWSTVANWDGLAPVSGDKLIFSGATRLINTNNLTALSVLSVSFNSGGFALYGNAFTVTGGITNATGNNALNGALTLSGALRIQSDAGTVALGGVVSGAGGLTKEGISLLQVSGASVNTYSGATLINAGTLSLAKSGGVNAIVGAITVGDGVGGAGVDILRLDAADQIIDSAAVNISASGRFDLNGFNETVASIPSASSLSQVVLGSGTLTVGDAGASTFAGSISGSGSLLKQGAGTLTLSGANTYSGATTINAGTVALGVGGSLASTTISLASNATYNVSALTGYALTASQTLSRNSAAGAGNVTGSVTFPSGAKASLMADGSGGTVGTLAIAGSLTLNSTVITINVTGAPLDVGTYSLITYTGTKTGSFNAVPTTTGLGLAMGLAAKIVETAGLISVKVYVPAHGVSAASIKVVENDLANTTNSVDVTTTVSINGLLVRDGSSRGDYTVQVGTTGTDDLANGVLIASVAENGRDHGEDSGINYCTAGISSTSSGYFIPTATAGDGSEYNINVSAAYFPYAKWLGGYARNSAGTIGGANDLLTASPGLALGTQFVDNGSGLSTVNLSSFGINSQTDGVLLVTAGANNNYYASSKANADGTWSVYVKNNLTNGATTTQGPVAFAFVPKTNVSVISGKFQGDGTILMSSGNSPGFSVVNTTNGTWKLTVPGYSSSKGVLVVSAEGGGGFNVDNIVSAQPSGSDWIIQSHDIPGMGLQTPPEAVASFVFIPAPTAALVAPANNATNIASAPTLKVTANGVTGENLTVTFYGRRAMIPGPGPDFLIPVLPDTQNYAREAAGSGTATREMWYSQTDWIVNHRVSDNIPYIATLGDCVQNGDTISGSPNTTEWKIATNAYYRVEKQSSTLLLEGIPYGVTVGNHDQDPNGDPDGTTTLYNQYFGSSHFVGKSYYGGNYDVNNDSWYDLFSAGGMDFLVISFEYGRYGSAILDWANSVAALYPTRRILVLTHHAGDDTPDDTTVAPFSAQGAAIYGALKTNPNFFMMLGGHVFNEGGEGRRSDTFNGHTVRTIISDYQGRFNGGNGLMRLMYFSPANNTISIKTYSPYTGNYETDANSQFSYTYNMQPNGAGSAATAYLALKTNINVIAGTQSTNLWSGLTASKPYQWYVTVANEVGDYSTSPEWNFTTTAGFARSAIGDANGDGIPDDWEATYGITDANADNDGDGQSNLAEYIARTNPTNAASVLRVIDASRDSDGKVTLTWSSVGGVQYRVQYADGIGGTFTDIVRDPASETDSGPSGEPSKQSFTDNDATLNQVRFYRIKVVP